MKVLIIQKGVFKEMAAKFIQKGVFKEMAAKFIRFSQLCFLIC